MFRKVFVSSALVLTGVAICLLSPWLARAEQPWVVLVSALQNIEAQTERDQELESQLAVARWRFDSGNLVAEALLQGRVSLMEAATWWHHNHDELADVSLPFSPKVTSNRVELACRHVIVRAEGLLIARNDPHQDKVIEHLQSELRDHVSHPGTLVFGELPELPEISPRPVQD